MSRRHSRRKARNHPGSEVRQPGRFQVHEFDHVRGQEVGGRGDRLRRARHHRGQDQAEIRSSVFQQALDNVMPSIEVRSRRVGGATYQVPVEVRTVAPPGARHPLDHRGGARPQRKDHDRAALGRAARRIQQPGQRRQEARRHAPMAEANRAFSHYRW